MLKGFATDACKQNRAIICCIIFFTFPEHRRHIRLSPIIWYSALSNRFILFIVKDRIGAISELHSFNTLALKPSGTGALCIFKLFNSLRTPLGSTIISPIGVNGLMLLPGISELSSHVKTDSNCLLQYQSSKFQCSPSVVIPNASFFRDLANDQNFFTLAFFLGQSGSGFSISKENILGICF